MRFFNRFYIDWSPKTDRFLKTTGLSGTDVRVVLCSQYATIQAIYMINFRLFPWYPHIFLSDFCMTWNLYARKNVLRPRRSLCLKNSWKIRNLLFSHGQKLNKMMYRLNNWNRLEKLDIKINTIGCLFEKMIAKLWFCIISFIIQCLNFESRFFFSECRFYAYFKWITSSTTFYLLRARDYREARVPSKPKCSQLTNLLLLAKSRLHSSLRQFWSCYDNRPPWRSPGKDCDQ